VQRTVAAEFAARIVSTNVTSTQPEPNQALSAVGQGHQRLRVQPSAGRGLCDGAVPLPGTGDRI